MKVCTQCNQELSLENFDKKISGKLGRAAICKLCVQHNRHAKSEVIRCLYDSQKGNSKLRGYSPPTYSKVELFDWLMGNPQFHTLYQRWVDSGYLSYFKPSCDRLDDLISYRLDNLRVTTWGENNQKGYNNRKSGDNNKTNIAVDMFNRDMTFIRRFHSIHEAARYCNGSVGHIWGAITNRVTKHRTGGVTREYTQYIAYDHKWSYSAIPNVCVETQ